MNERYINVGYVKDILAKKSIYSLNENVDDVGSEISEFINIVSDSEILKKEYDLFESVSNNHIPSEIVASKFLDKSISNFNNYTINEINNEHLKLKKFIDENVEIENKKNIFYKNISDLIYESLKTNESSNTNLLYESFTNILNEITTKKHTVEEEKNDNIVNENILNIAINKFNKKYSNLNENDISLLKKIITSDYNEKIEIYEEFKNENLKMLNNLILTESNNEDKIQKAINNIDQTLISEENINENIIKLYDLNIGLQEE